MRAFSYLDVVSLCRSAQVSKAWNVLALDGSNWQKVDLFEFQVDIEGIVVENLARRCGGFLKSLSLNGCQVSSHTTDNYCVILGHLLAYPPYPLPDDVIYERENDISIIDYFVRCTFTEHGYFSSGSNF